MSAIYRFGYMIDGNVLARSIGLGQRRHTSYNPGLSIYERQYAAHTPIIAMGD